MKNIRFKSILLDYFLIIIFEIKNYIRHIVLQKDQFCV